MIGMGDQLFADYFGLDGGAARHEDYHEQAIEYEQRIHDDAIAARAGRAEQDALERNLHHPSTPHEGAHSSGRRTTSGSKTTHGKNSSTRSRGKTSRGKTSSAHTTAAHKPGASKATSSPSRDPKTTVYRVESPGNARVNIDDSGGVSIQGDGTVFLNFGDESRAMSFHRRRLAQGYSGTVIKTFKVPTSYVDGLRASAVPESMARSFPDSPFALDVNQAADQFGIRPDGIPDLLDNVVPGSGEIW
jgi:hypothetical protein